MLRFLRLNLADSVQQDAEEDVEDDGGARNRHHRVRLHLKLVRVETVNCLQLKKIYKILSEASTIGHYIHTGSLHFQLQHM
jgi:hypothetical protein